MSDGTVPYKREIMEVLDVERVDGHVRIKDFRWITVMVHPDGHSERVVNPSDADQPLPALDTSFDTTDSTITRATEAWDAKMPEFAGLLDAAIDDGE